MKWLYILDLYVDQNFGRLVYELTEVKVAVEVLRAQ